MLRGFDVSHHQGYEDWIGMRDKYGLSFGFAKGTQREDFLDSQFPTNWAAMKSLHARGAYHFAEPDADPDDDVEAFLNYVNPSRPTDLLLLDLEKSLLSQADTNAWALGWAQHCRKLAPAYYPGAYLGQGYLMNDTGAGLRGPFGWLVYPRYPFAFQNKAAWPFSFSPAIPGGAASWGDTAWGEPPDFWQFSESFPVGSEDHDADVFDGTLTELETLNMALTKTDIDLLLNSPLKRVTPVKLADGTIDTDISVGDAIRYAYDRAVRDYTLDVAQSKALADLPAAIANLADPDEVKAKVAEVIQPLLGLLPGQ